MSPMLNNNMFLLAFLLAVPANAQLQAPPPAADTASPPMREPVEIHLRGSALLETEGILLSDVADIRGADAALFQHLSALDLGELSQDAASVNIRRSLVSIRLRLAGMDVDSFRMTGARASVVRRRTPEPITDTAIELAALPTMAVALGVEEADLRVKLNSPMMTSLPKVLQQDSRLRVEVLPPLTPRIGTVSLTVRLWRGPQLIQTRSGRFEVFQKQHVAITRTSLPRGHVIQLRDIQFFDRFLAAPADQLEESQVLGHETRNTVPAGTMLEVRDLKPAANSRGAQVIRPRDNVRVTAVSGRLRVDLTAAEAMQAGKLGDVIRVRNLKSKEVITGRVTGPGQLEIRL